MVPEGTTKRIQTRRNMSCSEEITSVLNTDRGEADDMHALKAAFELLILGWSKLYMPFVKNIMKNLK